MHMADALLSPAVAGVMCAASAGAAGVSIYNLKKEDREETLPLMAVGSALVFAGQMINYTIPGTGASGHICGGVLLTALLGPYAAFLSMVVILFIQALFFADGGILALGANIWNMAFYGCFVGYFLCWNPIVRRHDTLSRKRIIVASLLGCIISLQLGAFSVVLETSISGISEVPFAVFAGVMQPIHIAIGLIEGAITAAILVFVNKVRPELLSATNTENKRPLKSFVIATVICALAIGGGLSIFASQNPDGLEWAIGKTELVDETLLEGSDALVEYSSIGGVMGCAIVIVVCIALYLIVRKMHQNGQNR